MWNCFHVNATDGIQTKKKRTRWGLSTCLSTHLHVDVHDAREFKTHSTLLRVTLRTFSLAHAHKARENNAHTHNACFHVPRCSVARWPHRAHRYVHFAICLQRCTHVYIYFCQLTFMYQEFHTRVMHDMFCIRAPGFRWVWILIVTPSRSFSPSCRWELSWSPPYLLLLISPHTPRHHRHHRHLLRHCHRPS